MFFTHVLDVAQPMVGQSKAVPALDCPDAGTTIMATNNNVFDLQNIDGELQHGEAVEIAMRNNIGQIPMNKHFPRQEADDLIGGHAAIGTADPKVGRRLLAGEVLEEFRVRLPNAFGPGAVFFKELFQGTHERFGLLGCDWPLRFSSRSSSS